MLLAELSLIGQNKKAIFILLDGIPADVIENTATPYLDQIAAQGGYTRAFVGGEKGGGTESPTISAVGYNSLLTGTWANKHNVWGNSIKAPNYDFPTIFRVAKDYNSNLKTAVFSTWLDNRTKLIGEGLEATRNIQMDFAFDGFELDTLRFPHDEERDYIRQIDELVVNKTADYIAESSPDLSWVYLEYTDDMGHRYGDSEQLTNAVKLADDQVGRIWKAIQQREKENAEEWMIVITTDHGRTADTGKGHGGQSERERTTWIVTNQSNLTPAFFNQPGIVDIMPSICDFMGIEITEKVKANLYGKSFLK
jgi:predicted AlkP superfamily pyrophosphatase or phosphodiesterase